MPIKELSKDHPLSVVHQDLSEELEGLKKQPSVSPLGAEGLVKPFNDFFAEFIKPERTEPAVQLLENKHKEAVDALKKLLRDAKLNKTQKAILDRFELFHPKDEAYYHAREALRISTNDKNNNTELRQLGADLLERIDNYHERNTKKTSPENDPKITAQNKKHKETFTQIFECLKIGIDRPYDQDNALKLKQLVKLLPKKELSHVGRIVRGIGIFLICVGILFTAMSLTLLIITSGGAAPVVAAPLALATLCIIGGLVAFLKRYSLFGKHTQEYQRNEEVTAIKHQLGLFQRYMQNSPPPSPNQNNALGTRVSASAI